MPIDTSIYGMVRQQPQGPGPLDLAAKGLQVKALMGQDQMQQMQMAEAQRAQQEQQQVRDLFRQGNVTPEQLMAISPQRGLEYGRGLREQQKGISELLAADDKLIQSFASQGKQELQSVTDQAGWDRYRALQAQRAGALQTPQYRELATKKLGMMPEQFDPRFIQRQLAGGADLVTPKPQGMNLGGTERIVDMNPLTNPQVVGQEFQRTAPPQPPQGATWDSERGVWVQPPTRGSMAPGTATPSPTALPPRVGDVASLRKEFNDLPEVKNFRSVVPIYNSALKAPDTRAGDIQFAYTIGKIFDPNSVVREGELKLVGEAATVLQKYIGELRTLTEGKGQLSPQTRQELLETARARVSELEAAQQAARNTYERQATQRGLPVDQIFIDMPKLEKPKSATPTGIPPNAPRKVIGRNKYVEIDGKWYEER